MAKQSVNISSSNFECNQCHTLPCAQFLPLSYAYVLKCVFSKLNFDIQWLL